MTECHPPDQPRGRPESTAATLTNLLYRIVFSTKDRVPLIRSVFRDEREKYIAGIIRNEGGILLDVGGMSDHFHLVARFKPDRSVAEMVGLIKANSSKWINERYGATGRFAWQSGYGAFSVSQSQLGALQEYVRHQEEHHRIRSFQDEYREFLNRHGIVCESNIFGVSALGGPDSSDDVAPAGLGLTRG